MTRVASLSQRFKQAQEEGDPSKKVDALEALQPEVALLISSNEELDEIATASLPYLSLEHVLAEAYSGLFSGSRLSHLRKACELWHAFVEKLERLNLLEAPERKQFHTLIEVQESIENNTSKDTMPKLPPPISRDEKIARFQLQKEAKSERERFRSLQQRRQRLGVTADETMDGYDDESLERSISLVLVGKIHKLQALEGWNGVLQELPLCAMRESATTPRPPPPPSSKQGLQLTQITQDPTTGQLNIQRQQVQSTVFRPGWNQPTMSLDELAEREVQGARAREAAQKEAEAERANAPRRYEFLRRDGLEDNAELVDASAALDRAWDDFKDENPRGSGNKRGDVGDRNC